MAVLEDAKGDPGQIMVWGDDLNEYNWTPRTIKSLEGLKVASLGCTSLTTVITTTQRVVYQWSIESENKLQIVAEPTLKITKVACGGAVSISPVG